MASQIKDSELICISNAHHLTNLDNPKEVNSHIKAFIINLDSPVRVAFILKS